jgi:ATP-dependent protease HslVU (ClpYQ) peptidase subunit
MTCIVAVKHEDHVVMGGDSAGVAGLDIILRKDPKVFRNGNFVIGYTSSFRMGQLLRFKMKLPPVPRKMDMFEYMVVHFTETARKTLKKGGYSKVNNNQEDGGCFLVAYQDRMFTIHDDFQVEERTDPYGAVGCGEAYALGALAAAPDKDPTKMVTTALKVAEKFSGGVRGPFVILRT